MKEDGITFIKWDIKNQFTNLSKKKVIQALKHALNEIQKETKKSNFALRRIKEEHHSDKIGTGTPRTWTTISFQEVMQYTIFELENPYIKVGTHIYKQIEGLPMGGYLSAGLAVIYSMYMENLHQNKWRHIGKKVKWFRYRDDIMAIIQGALNIDEIQSIQAGLQVMYGNELKVELEYTSNEYSQFLEFQMWHIDDHIKIWNFNKNINIIHGNSQLENIVRYPEFSADIDKSVLKGMIMGAFIKSIKMANSFGGQLIGTIETALELRRKNYPIKWIIRALKVDCKSIIQIKSVLKQTLNLWR
ncbi:MAG: hypothetical protein ACREBJ_11930 [Nitrosotalea sp.]